MKLASFSHSCSRRILSNFLENRGVLFSTSATNNAERVAELRQYSVKPDKVGTLEKLFTKYIGTRYVHSKPIGFWKAELGTTINKLVSIWEYDNLTQRAGVRLALTKDAKWVNEFLPAAMACLDVQENSVMYAAPWSESLVSNKESGSGLYELATITMESGGPTVWESGLKSYVEKVAGREGCELAGAWYNDIGNTDNVYLLWRYRDFESRLGCGVALKDSGFLKCRREHSSMILLPSAWSPMQ